MTPILFYILYNILLFVALPFIWVVSYFNDKLGRNLAGQRDLWRALERFNNKVKDEQKPVIWLHAASAGEFEQIRPVLSRLKHKNVYVFQTLTSSTIYYKVSQSNDFDGVSFLPWDLPRRLDRFIRTLRPSLFINTRHDLWPNLLRSLQKHDIRSVLINANLYQNSLRLKPFLKQINRSIFQQIDHIYTGSNELQELIRQLYDGPIEVTGDTRFDQVSERAAANQTKFLTEENIADRRVIVYGSVVPSDLSPVCQAIAASAQNDYLHIIVPHEVSEKDLIPWEVELYRHKIRSIRRTEFEQYQQEPIILWNTIGELADLYTHADLAYIGAGFTTGVHSVTEAAVYHVPAAHGPVFDILAEAIELVDLQLSTVVQDHRDLLAFLQMNSEQIQALNAKIKSFIQQRVGATDRILKQEIKF